LRDKALLCLLVLALIIPKSQPSAQEVLDNALKGVFRIKSNKIRYLLVNTALDRII